MIAIALIATLAGSAPAYARKLCDSRSAECATQAPYPSETAIEASLESGTELVLATSNGTVKCTSSSLKGKTTAESGEPLPVEVTAFSFSGCAQEGTPCTATIISPYSGSIEAGSEGNGTLALKEGGTLFECEESLHCVYGNLTLEVKGGAPAKLKANELNLPKLSGLLCPATSKLTATYTLSAPNPAFVEE